MSTMREWTMRDALAIVTLKELVEANKVTDSSDTIGELVWCISVLAHKDIEDLFDMPQSEFNILVKATVEEAAIRVKHARTEMDMSTMVQDALGDIKSGEEAT